MNHKKMAVFMLLGILLALLSGCGATVSGGEREESSQIKTALDTQTEETAAEDETESDAILDQLADIMFTYSPDIGEGNSDLEIYPDGFFRLEYQNTNLGDSGKDYENGTVYQSMLIGMLGEPEQINAYTYRARIIKEKQKETPGEEQISNNVRYVSYEAVGMQLADEIYIYLPSAPITDLPEGFLESVIKNRRKKSDTLDFYGVFSEKDESGFIGYEVSDKSIEDRVRAFEGNEVSVCQKNLENAQTQLAIGANAARLYQLWDQMLNFVWQDIKMRKSDEEYEELLEEQRNWIKIRDLEMSKTQKSAEGGSVQAAEQSLKGAELTRMRVYELMEYDR